MTNTTCSGQFCSNSWLCISGRPFPIRKTSISVHQFSPMKIMIFSLNCSLDRIVKYGIKTQFCQCSRHLMYQSPWPKVSKWLKLLCAMMLAPIWTNKNLENQKLINLICWTLLDHWNHCRGGQIMPTHSFDFRTFIRHLYCIGHRNRGRRGDHPYRILEIK